MTAIIAHRGASRDCLENSMAAFSRALDLGADGIELDVHMSSDGVVVVHHDPVIQVSQQGRRIPIAATGWNDLQQHRLANHERIPRLDEVLRLVGGKAKVYVEVKGLGMERQIAELLDRFADVECAVHAFDHRIPIRVRRLRPRTEIGLLSTSYPISLEAFLGAARPVTLWQHWAMIDQDLVSEANRLDMPVIAWTENDPAHGAELRTMGVSALCTDTPDVMRT